MRFLPIVDRELRVAARRSRTYWVRLLVALVSIAIGAIMLGAYALTQQPQAQIGRTLFQALSGLAFFYCLFAGRLSTADSISSEKRDGTLGLLFLTDLKGYDIVLGKMVATSLNAFYGLLAMLPVLALPLLLGGMTHAEFGRMVVVLVSTFLLSLAIGIFASALSRDSREAYGTNLLLTLAIMALLPWLAAYLYARLNHLSLTPDLFAASPLFALFCAHDSLHVLAPAKFWWSIGIAFTWSLLLIFIACLAVPRTWQDLPSSTTSRRRTWRDFWRLVNYGRAAKLIPYRKRLLDVNGFYWLAARVRLKPVHVWLFVFSAMAWWLVGWWFTEGSVWLAPETGIVLALLQNSGLKMWIAIESGQQLAEDRRVGAMELLLSTPLTVGDIVKGQLLALRRLFLGPLLVIIVIELCFMFASLRDYYETRTLYLWLAGILMLVVDCVALIFTALAAAITSKNPQHAVLKTFFRILVLPWLAFAAIFILAGLWVSLGSGGGETLPWQFNLALWVGLGLAADLAFGLHGARLLFTRFRQLATERFDASPPQTHRRRRFRKGETLDAVPAHAASVAGEPTPPTRPRRRRWVVAAAALVLLLMLGVYVYRQLNVRPPGPGTIRLAATDPLEQLGVFPRGAGFYLIPPDGSLWQWGLSPGGSPPLRQVDPEKRWRSVHASNNGTYGLQRDGTLWHIIADREGGFARLDQVGGDRDWQSIFVGHQHFGGIKQDGSLWMWGDNRKRQLGTEAAALQADPIQVGTRRNWKQVVAFGNCTLGLQTDGSLWFWGEVPHLYKTNTRSGQIMPEPIRYCLETNWVALGRHWGTLARDSAGDWHSLFFDRPDPASSANNNARIAVKDSRTDELVFGLMTQPGLIPAMFVVRDDHTLWQTTYTHPSALSVPTSTWQQFDGRTDWLRVWSNGSTMLGLAGDGTLQMWGLDPTVQPSGLALRLARLEQHLLELFNTMPRFGVNVGSPVLQHEPRTVIEFVKQE